MIDLIADILSHIRSANNAYHNSVSMLSSRLKASIAEILRSKGYIADYAVEDAKIGKILTLNLKYGLSRERSIVDARRASKPGLRAYAESTSLLKVLGDLGVIITSMPQGLLTDRQAYEEKVGGEILAYIW